MSGPTFAARKEGVLRPTHFLEEMAMPENTSPATISLPPIPNPVEDVLGGSNARGEVAGCPTGLAGDAPAPHADAGAVPAKENTLSPPEKLEARQGQDDAP
jgi:hypothetical protein